MSEVKFVQAKPTTLSVGISAAESSEIILKRLVDIYGNALALSDFGEIIYLTIDPGGTAEEIISATGFTVNADNTVSLDTGIVRALKAKSDYSTGGTASAHAAGTKVVVSNNPQIYASLVSLTGSQTINGVKTYASGYLPRVTSEDPTDDNELARKAYVDSVVAGSYPANRIVVSGTAGATVAAGDLVYLDTSDGEWKLCDADTASSVENVFLGIAQGAGTDGNTIASGVLVRGYDNNQTGLTANNIYYASNTAGDISNSAGTKEVTIGFSLSTTEIYFSPGFNQHITEDIQDALVGTSGTPSASNKYVTADDVSAAAGSGKIVRATGTALPALDGSNLTGVGKPIDVQEFTSGGTWTKPSGASRVLVRLWGAGGSGASSASGSPDDASGGGGGAYTEAWFDASDLGATETVTIGSGGAGVLGGGGAATPGNDGGNSSFGSLLQANGGKGGNAGTTDQAGGNGGVVPNLVAVNGLFGIGASADAGDGLYSGAGGSSGADKNGGNSHYGGAGGGGSTDGSSSGSGGTSNLGGNGGAGSHTGAGAAGTVPAGGGGGSTNTTSGAGADGQCIVITFF